MSLFVGILNVSASYALVSLFINFTNKSRLFSPMFFQLLTLGLQVVFKTRIFHCNVDTAGVLSLDILKDSWSPALTITKVLLAIRAIFTNPDPCKFS